MERKIRSLPPAHFGRKPLGRGQLAGFSSAAADRPVWLRHLRFRSRLEKSATAKSTAKNRLNSGAGKDRGKVAQEVRAGFGAKRFSSWQTEAEVPMITILTIIIV
jgi:hypothetical protein